MVTATMALVFAYLLTHGAFDAHDPRHPRGAFADFRHVITCNTVDDAAAVLNYHLHNEGAGLKDYPKDGACQRRVLLGVRVREPLIQPRDGISLLWVTTAVEGRDHYVFIEHKRSEGE